MLTYRPITETEIELIPPTKVAKITLSLALGKYDFVTYKLSDCPKNMLDTKFTAIRVSILNTFAIPLPTTLINF